jgi:hypothetical protein
MLDLYTAKYHGICPQGDCVLLDETWVEFRAA